MVLQDLGAGKCNDANENIDRFYWVVVTGSSVPMSITRRYVKEAMEL
jgi:predicted DNA-binding WGR domain protein